MTKVSWEGKALKTRKALINSQNRISYVFLSNAASSVSLHSDFPAEKERIT